MMVSFPRTTPHHYLTGKTALNVPFEEECGGDWHFREAFFGRGTRSPVFFLAGEGEKLNTNAIFNCLTTNVAHKMDKIEYSALNDEEKHHIALMQRIANSVIDTPLVLKGGTAFLLAYGLDRFSEDLDFDSNKGFYAQRPPMFTLAGAVRATP